MYGHSLPIPQKRRLNFVSKPLSFHFASHSDMGTTDTHASPILPLPLPEYLHRKLIRHSLIPCHTRMEPVSRIILLIQHLRIPALRQYRCHIHTVIINRTLHNPLIHPLPCLLPLRTCITVSPKRHDRPANGNVPQLLRVTSDLGICGDEPVPDAGLRRSAVRAGPDVVYAFEDHDIFRTRLLECVARVARQEGWAQAARQHGVATCGLVGDGEVGDVDGWGLEAREEEVWPAIVVLAE
jgi:hypothetical protein